MAELPYLRLYVGDRMAEMSAWRGDAQGLFLQLILVGWSNGGALPCDEETLALLTRRTPREFRALWGIVKQKFVQQGDALVLPWLAELHRSTLAEVQGKSLGAAKTNAKRWSAKSQSESVSEPVSDSQSDSVSDSESASQSRFHIPDSKDQTSETKDQKKTSVESGNSTSRDTAVRRVFQHWQTVHDHPRAQFDEKRERLIRKALRSYSEADLCLSITGYASSPHHMGQNDQGTRYDSIELFLRDSQRIEAGLQFAAKPPAAKPNGGGPERQTRADHMRSKLDELGAGDDSIEF